MLLVGATVARNSTTFYGKCGVAEDEELFNERYYDKGSKNQVVLDEVKYSGDKEITCIEAIDISTDIESGSVEIAKTNSGGIGKTSVRLFVQSAVISGGYDFQIIIFGKK
ncbi:unnamed protein product [Diamesa hyperborea]